MKLNRFARLTSAALCLLAACACHPAAAAQALTSVPPAGTLISDRGIVLNSAAHKIYAVDQSHGAVVVIDLRTGRTTSIPTGTHPDAVAVNNTTNRVYVVNSGSGNVSVLDGAADRVTATIPTDRRPYYIALNEATGKAYVSNTFSKVMTVLDLATNTPNDWPIGSGDAVAIDPKKNQVYLLGYEDPNLRIMDAATGTVTREPVGSIHAWAPAVDPILRKLYVTRVGSADVLVVDLETRAHSVIPVGHFPCALAIDPAIDPANHTVWVTNYGDNSVTAIDGLTGTVKATLPTGSHPQSVAVDPQRHRVYVGNTEANSVTVIDSAHMKVLRTLPAGPHPYALVADPESGAVFAGNMPDPENPEAPVFTAVIPAAPSKAKPAPAAK